MPLLILIAEDDPGIRLSVSDYLELSGYSVVAAENGIKALSMLEKYHPHLLITDVRMPKKNGYELVKSIRQLPKYRLLPVILLTECKDTTERIRGYQVGCDIYLPKPFEMEELGAVIRNLLERSQIIHSELRFSQSDLQHELEPNSNFVEEESDNNNSFKQSKLAELIDLTMREKEVLKLLMNGHSNIEIGQKLHLSHRTIEKYVSSLLRKSDTSNRIELIRFALEHKLAPLNS
ncbi:response regulator transcription factor [Waterburya agarophytonicola K14]|uniref:Response regulator transcription factor n=1 Tax=Waterburya agarophytonicola KI4 TaxID=2874699 RepID=A0A964BR11_9CYAN|nr:response regulator transcription factor [Waterburya agarophytonicola]MCC0177291.1 response regulator transcription factor [Waterburya agarophytonicola KI4]